MNSRMQSGFTLIELMVVVVIIAILAGIAYPNYTRYIMQARRADGQSAALQLAAQLEKYYTQCSSYTTNIPGGSIPQCTGLGHPAMSSEQHYNLAVVAGPTGDIATSYLIQVAPAPGSSQQRDSDCATLTLDSKGKKAQTGPNSTGRCWQR